MNSNIAICWFRQDLRLCDHPALLAAVKHQKVLPIYIFDDALSKKEERSEMGAACRWWLHHSLDSLNASLNGKLTLFHGDAHQILLELVKRLGIEAVYWNRCYEPWRMTRDTNIKEALKAQGVNVASFNGSLLWEPWTIAKEDGTPYKVFTPFYKKGCLLAPPPRAALPSPWEREEGFDEKLVEPSVTGSLSLQELSLLPTTGWDAQLKSHWIIGEEGAKKRLAAFLREGLAHYKEGRNLPAEPYVSRLSPYLRHGEISAHQVWEAALLQRADVHREHFCSELGWREFSYSLLYHNQELPKKNLQAKFDHFPWRKGVEAKDDLIAWQKGMTGIPMVDAGMRELWQTGYMHNRVRMIVGSFLVKNLLLDWREGERWFWDTLVDADLANNSASWQWIAGCGADAAPYFRIFNPVTQGQKFDPEGRYLRRFLPELASLPTKHLFAPWEAPETILRAAGIELGLHYPRPCVDLKASRARALEAFSSLGKEGAEL